MSLIFKNPAHQDVFDKQGFVVINILTEQECDEICAFHANLNPKISDVFYATQNSTDYNYRLAVENYLHPIFEKMKEKIFTNHRVLYTQYMVKHSGSNGECQLHQDWTFVDEPEQIAVNFWCALSDTNTNNGCLWFMPGIHRLKNYIRGRNIERASLENQNFIRKLFLRPIELKKGQAVLFNCSLLHESKDNTSGCDRMAMAAIIISTSARPIHYMRENGDDEYVVKVDADTNFYVDHYCNEMPKEYEVKNKVNLPPVSFSKLQLMLAYLTAKF